LPGSFGVFFGQNAVARKNIAIDLNTYERLRSLRGEGESFSQIINRLVKPPVDVEVPHRRVGDVSTSGNALETVEREAQQPP
jgi:predicted CopG family antitoxin